ncbi:hypothetical protein CK203_014326 [Vitis vinifera]|uniref:Reverse transcriptase RNase H-like domain-containing protein n=1 Tax=Vitis vinifera TaxID=29760 RepID=A0A438K520_VITVI|nr:hypothetical protein CK203_014326 [Vitis vinifera]
MQRLTSRLVALGQFIALFTGKLYPFFTTLSRVSLVGIETWYSQVEQMALALCIATKKLCPYFQAHQVTILTNQPLRITLHKLDSSEQM